MAVATVAVAAAAVAAVAVIAAVAAALPARACGEKYSILRPFEMLLHLLHKLLRVHRRDGQPR